MQNLYFPPFSQGAPTQTRRDNANTRTHTPQWRIHTTAALKNYWDIQRSNSPANRTAAPRHPSRLRERVFRDETKEDARARNTWFILSNACPIFVMPQIVQSLETKIKNRNPGKPNIKYEYTHPKMAIHDISCLCRLCTSSMRYELDLSIY